MKGVCAQCTEILWNQGQGLSERDIGIRIYRMLWAAGLVRVYGRAVDIRQEFWMDPLAACLWGHFPGTWGCQKAEVVSEGQRRVAARTPRPKYTSPVTEALWLRCSEIPGMRKVTLLVFTQSLRLRGEDRGLSRVTEGGGWLGPPCSLPSLVPLAQLLPL